MTACLIAIGGNLPAPDGAAPSESCERAIRALRALAIGQVVRRSRYWSSAPVPASGQPRFVNGVARLHAALGPEALLAALHEIETRFGRVRSVPNEARTLDLDLLDWGGIVRREGAPVLPHPRLHLRGFVLLPLRDVEPEWCHPVTGEGVAAMLARTDPGDVRPLASIRA